MLTAVFALYKQADIQASELLLRYSKIHLEKKVIPLLEEFDENEKFEIFNNDLIFKIFFE